jgi:hypothetical protein
VVSAAPAHAATNTIHVDSVINPFDDGFIDITGTYQCDSPTFPGFEVDVTQNRNIHTDGLLKGDQCDGTTRSFETDFFNSNFVNGDATYNACLYDTGDVTDEGTTCPLNGSGDAQLASENGQVTISTPTVSAVQDLTVTQTTTSTITLTWSPPSSTGERPIIAYEVSIQGPSSRTFDSEADSPTWTFRHLNSGTPFKMTVLAVNNQGVEGPPTPISASTDTPSSPPPPPPPPPPAPSRTRLHLTIHASRHHIKPTHLVVIHGAVRPHHRVLIELQRRVDGVWVAANGGTRRASGGHYHFEIRPSTRFIGRIVMHRTTRFKASHSKKVIIRIKH